MFMAMRRASVAREQVSSRAAAGVILEIDVGERVPVRIADDEAGFVHLLDRPRRREAAGRMDVED